MAEVPLDDSSGEVLSSALKSSSNSDEMDLLRRLLMAPERERLADADERLRFLENRPTDVTADQLATLLPAAVIERSARDGHLAAALEPTIEETLRGSVRRNPQPLVDAIFPVIGPAIRRAISEALNSTLESVNRSMEHQFSLQGLKWRFEALRTGQEFSEVVLRNTLLYATEQLFVIHNETGLPLVSASRVEDEEQDGALVTSMLSVIQDFVRDSLGGDQADSLESIEYGDLTILFEPGPVATLAAVIRGAPPRSVREDTQEIIEEFHLRYRKEITDYRGDVSSFEKAKPLLESHLKVQMSESPGAGWKTWLMLGLLLVGLIALGVFLFRSNANWDNFVAEVDATPGIVVTEVASQGGVRVVRGLRDPLSDDPVPLVSEYGYEDNGVRFDFEPFRALTPDMVARRASQVLDAPETTSFTFENQTLYASGLARRVWIEQARIRAVQLEDVPNYDDLAVVDLDVKDIHALSDEILRVPIRFAESEVRPINSDGLLQLATLAGKAIEIAETAGIPLVVVVRGFSSADGSPVVNQRLERARAEAVVAEMVTLGIPVGKLSVESGGAAEPEVRVLLRILE